MRQRAILGSAAGLYDADALEAWASGGSEDDLRHKIKTTREKVQRLSLAR